MIKHRKIYAIQLSYEVSDADRNRANKAVMWLDFMLKTMKNCNSHLDLIYAPFKDNSNVSPEELYKVRAALRRFRDKAVENFTYLKKVAFKCYLALQPFSTDTQIIKLMKSFTLSVGDIEKQFNRFVELFSNLEDKEFTQSVVKAIDNIKKEMAKLEQIIEDRMKEHLAKNILARSWINGISDELQEKIEQKLPMSVELVNERNEKSKEKQGE